MNESIGLGGLVLAYIGDAVLELLLREKLIASGISDTGRLNAAAQKLVCATAQSERVERLLPVLTEEELSVYKLGRNGHTGSHPKSASAVEYHRATGMEALFGFLHMEKREARIRELFEIAYGS